METIKILDTSSLMNEKSGTTTIYSVLEYPTCVEKNFNVLWPERNDYLTALEIIKGLYKIGRPIPAIDVLIASIAINRDLPLKTKDKHFEYVKSINKNLKLELVK